MQTQTMPQLDEPVVTFQRGNIIVLKKPFPGRLLPAKCEYDTYLKRYAKANVIRVEKVIPVPFEVRNSVGHHQLLQISIDGEIAMDPAHETPAWISGIWFGKY